MAIAVTTPDDKMSTPITCPACGSADVRTSYRDSTLEVPLAPPATYRERVDECRTCGTDGDFLGENDARIDEALSRAGKASARHLIESLADDGVSMAYFERALGLSPRTLTRWKAGECSASSLALLRLVRTYPWLLRVADASYNETAARDELLRTANSTVSEDTSGSSLTYLLLTDLLRAQQSRWELAAAMSTKLVLWESCSRQVWNVRAVASEASDVPADYVTCAGPPNVHKPLLWELTATSK